MTRVKEDDFCEGKVSNLEETRDAQGWNRLMESVRWARGICFENADPLALVSDRWRVADEVKKGGEDPDSTRILMIRL